MSLLLALTGGGATAHADNLLAGSYVVTGHALNDIIVSVSLFSGGGSPARQFFHSLPDKQPIHEQADQQIALSDSVIDTVEQSASFQPELSSLASQFEQKSTGEKLMPGRFNRIPIKELGIKPVQNEAPEAIQGDDKFAIALLMMH